MKELLIEINENIKYIEEKDKYNVYALQSLSYFRERLEFMKCVNCNNFIEKNVQDKRYNGKCNNFMSITNGMNVVFSFCCSEWELKNKKSQS